MFPRPLRAAWAAAALCSLAGPAAARSSHDLYLSLNTGLSHAPVDSPAGQRGHRHKIGGKLTLGAFVTDQFALEGRWAQLGNTGVDTGMDTGAEAGTPATLTRSRTTRSSLALGGAYWQEFGPRTYGVLRAGAGSERVSTRVETTDGSGAVTGTSTAQRRSAPYAGLGVLQAFAPSAHLVADLDLIRSHDGSGQRRNVVALTVGLGLRF